MLKQLQILILILFLAGFFPDKVFAQFPYAESFMNSTAPGINFGGVPTAFLTSGTGSDAVGNGYLRLTANGNSQKGYAFSSNSFPSSKGISVNFEYFTYGGNGADGICFFLYDASVADGSFNVGSYGGGLGYTDISSTGLTRGYLGIGLDEFGNFCTTNAGGRGPTRTAKLPNSVTIRGAYDDPNGAYYMLNTVQLAQATHGFSTIGSGGTTRITAGNTGYRKVYIDILPHSAGVGFDITVKIKYDAVSTPVTIINNYYYNKASPANLKFGYAASTGGSTNFHEIRNTSVNLPTGTALSAPTQTDQSFTACSTGSGSVNISGGFSTTNSPNGAINTASVDLDPTTTGIQTTYAVASKGTFTTDGNGNIIFTPLNIGVTGTASCSFTVNDNYGATSNTATVTATIITGPALTVTNPAAVCAPSTVDLTASAVTTGSDNNLTLSYFSDAAATIALSNPSAVASSGTYYIKAINSNNCAVIKPVTVVINPLPTTSNAGSNQNITAAIPASATLNGNMPVYGTGLWSQVSGPTTANFSNAAQYNTSVSNLNPGTYVFSWTITNSCGTSASNVNITVLGTQSIAFGSIPTKTYGDADFTISASASSGLAVGYASSNPAVATVDNAGNIHILTAGTTNITASQSGNSSYAAATPVTQILTVNKALLTVTADNQTKAYGAANPALTVNYAGFVNGETPANLSTLPTASTSANTTSDAGNYPISVSAASGNNYAFTYTAGTLTIGQISQTLSFNSTVSSKVYGDADFSLSATASSGLPVVYTSSDPAIATIDAAGTVHILAAGNVTITASQPGNSNYSAATAVTQFISINKASLTIASNNQTTTYGTSPAPTAAYTGFVNNENSTNLTTQPSISTTATNTSPVGNYPITVGGAASNNYTIAYTPGTLTISQSAQTISFNTLSAKTYGDPDFSLTATATSGLQLIYASSNPAIATVDAQGVIHIVAAGSVTITASQPGNSNYNAATAVAQILTVNKASLIVSADNQTKTYGSANPALTISYSGFVNGENSTGLTAQPAISTTATTASAVGNYPITVTGGASVNYQITYVNGVLSVGQSTPAITFNTLPVKVYGDADFNLSATASSGLPVTYSSNNPAIATVDAQGRVHILAAGTVVITASQSGNGNYNPAVAVPQTLTVNRAALTISAENKTKQYAENNPAFTVSYSGFVNGENSTNLSAQPTVNTTATATSATGTYPLTVTGATAANYRITYVNGAFTIFPGTQTITFVASPKTYGEPDFTLSAVASSGLPVTYSSSNTAVATVDANGQVHIVAAGNVIITASQPGNGNFIATTNINQQLTINKAVLVVKADDLTKVYGAANPPLTISYSGFVYADNNTNLTTQPVVRTAVTAASAVGIYPVTVAGAASPNYSFVYQAGTLSVGQNNQEITFAALSDKIYGDADFTLAGSSTSGLPVSYISSDPSVATVDAAGTVHILSAGTTTITANQTGNENYSGAAAVAQILSVNKAPLTITADNQSKTYGAANPTLTFTYTGFVNAETSTNLATTPTISTTAAATSAAGVYPIAISDATAANYAITFTPGTLTIAKATLTVTADDKARVYGLANPPFTVTYSGFVNGETAANIGTVPQLATTANASSPAGIYPITISGGPAANYNFTFVPGTLTVTNATINSVSLAQISLLENQPVATLAGTLAAASLNPAAVYTYSLVAGTGAADNALFAIAGNKVVTARSLDYEQKSGYSILVRATNQYGLYLDQVFSINIIDVNEAPTLAAIPNQTVCYSLSTQNIGLSGITPGPESTQNNNLSVSSTNPRLFKNLSVTAVSGGTATLNYQLTGSGTAAITVTNQDNGGTANGGTDSFSQTFTITANDIPVANIASDKGTQILKGQTVTLTASGGSSYSWDNAFGITGSTSSATIQVRPNQTTTYQVKVSNASGCSTLSSITINVADDYAAIHPANILTPNGDGKNDTWVVKNIDLYPNNTISIFDRGGRKLIEVKGYNNDWDGTLNGSPLAEGTYYYVIDFGTGVPLKGFITILRNR